MHPTMFCDGGSHQPLFIEDPMMVPVLLNFIKDKLSFNAERLSLVQRDAEYLQREYASGGRYALDPQNNPRDNLMTINHLMNLLSKKKTINEVERGALNRFLTERYK